MKDVMTMLGVPIGLGTYVYSSPTSWQRRTPKRRGIPFSPYRAEIELASFKGTLDQILTGFDDYN